MKKIYIYILMILGPGIGVALAKLIFDPLFKNQEVTFEGLLPFFVYGCIAGAILLILRLLIRGPVSTKA